MDIIKTSAKFIKEKREAKGWTQKELADKVFGPRLMPNSKVEDNRHRISRIESGKHNFSLKLLGQILKQLDSVIDFKELR